MSIGDIMAITKDDLRNFTLFAEEVLANGGADSIIELASEWEAQRAEDCSTVENRTIQVDEETLRALAKAFPETDEQQLQRALARRGGVTTAEMLGKAVLAAYRANRG
jgi:hypothetical protein